MKIDIGSIWPVAMPSVKELAVNGFRLDGKVKLHNLKYIEKSFKEKKYECSEIDTEKY